MPVEWSYFWGTCNDYIIESDQLYTPPVEWIWDEYNIYDDTVIFDYILGECSNEQTHIQPRDWFSIVWLTYDYSYTYDRGGQDEWTKTWTITVYKWWTETFWDLVTDAPVTIDWSNWSFKGTFTFIRKDNQNNKIVTSYKDNIQYLLWWSGWGNSYAPNSPDKPKYHRVWPEEDYQALENKYTEQENDTMFFTY